MVDEQIDDDTSYSSFYLMPYSVPCPISIKASSLLEVTAFLSSTWTLISAPITRRFKASYFPSYFITKTD